MKVRFHLDDFEHSGFENYKFGSETNFDAGELDCLWLDDVLNSVSIDKVDDTFRDMVRLIKRGGSLIINGTDLYEVSKALTNYNIDIQIANKLMYDGGKRNCFTINFVIDTLKNYGLSIKTKRVSGYQYSVEAVR